jgi:glutamyl-tRNA(Gln) amidotransferase subunit E
MEFLQKIKIPEKPEEKQYRLKKEYGLNDEQTMQLLSSGFDDNFERLTKQFPELKNVIIRTLLNTFSELENEGILVNLIDNSILITIFSGLNKHMFAKEAVPILLKYFALHQGDSLDMALSSCGLDKISDLEVIHIVQQILIERKDFIHKKGKDAIGPIMGVVMKEFRGKVDGKILNKILLDEIEKILTE